MDPFSLIGSMIGAGLNVWDFFDKKHLQEWMKGQITEQQNRTAQAIQGGQNAWQNSANPVRDTGLQAGDRYRYDLMGPGGSQEMLSTILQNYPGMVDQLLGQGSDPYGRGMNGQMSSLLNQNMENRGMFQGGADTALAGFQGGGWSQPRQDAQNQFMDMLLGRGSEMSGLSGVGTDLLSQRGANQYTTDYQKMATSAMGSGGMTDPLRQAQDIANQAGQRGLSLLNRDALLPMDQVYNAAGEGAFRAGDSAFKRAQRQALARKGGSASVVAAGESQNDPFSEYEDTLSKQVADARRQALQGQQGLGLQQMGLGSQTALGGGGLFPQLQNSATNLATGYGGLGLGAGQLENSRMWTGNALLDSFIKTQLGGGSLVNQGLTGMQDYAMGLGGLANQFGNSYQNAGNQGYNNILNAGQFGAGLNQQQYNGMNSYFNNMLNFNGQNSSNLQNLSMNPLFNLSNQGLQLYQTGLGAAPPPLQTVNNSQPVQNLTQGLSKVSGPMFGAGGGGSTSGGVIGGAPNSPWGF